MKKYKEDTELVYVSFYNAYPNCLMPILMGDASYISPRNHLIFGQYTDLSIGLVYVTDCHHFLKIVMISLTSSSTFSSSEIYFENQYFRVVAFFLDFFKIFIFKRYMKIFLTYMSIIFVTFCTCQLHVCRTVVTNECQRITMSTGGKIMRKKYIFFFIFVMRRHE
jgi:hypothetical protein